MTPKCVNASVGIRKKGEALSGMQLSTRLERTVLSVGKVITLFILAKHLNFTTTLPTY